MKNGHGRPTYTCRFCGWAKADAWPALALHLATDHPDVQVVEPMGDVEPLIVFGGESVTAWGWSWHTRKRRHAGAL